MNKLDIDTTVVRVDDAISAEFFFSWPENHVMRLTYSLTCKHGTVLGQ